MICTFCMLRLFHWFMCVCSNTICITYVLTFLLCVFIWGIFVWRLFTRFRSYIFKLKGLNLADPTLFVMVWRQKKNMKNQWNTQTKPLGRFPFSNRLNISQSLSSNYNQLRLVPKGSVYGIVTCIYHKNQPIDGSYGIGRMLIGKARDAS